MREVVRSLALSVAIAVASVSVAPAWAAEGPFPGRDAREVLPPALIGPWKVDMAASHYAGTAPKTATRTFEYTEDGKVLVTFQSLATNGKYTSGHWSAYADGSPAIEYHSTAGSTPFNVVRFTMKDTGHFDLLVSRYGKVSIRATYALAADGKTLTYSYDGNVIIYRRWDMLD